MDQEMGHKKANSFNNFSNVKAQWYKIKKKYAAYQVKSMFDEAMWKSK